LLKSHPSAIEADWVVIVAPAPHLQKESSMKHRHLSPSARALFTFLGTVVLALLASMALLTPDVAVPAVESMTAIPSGLDQILPTGLFK